MSRVIVTCGPSFEPIDQVRRITNFSTGELGILLANALTSAGHDELVRAILSVADGGVILGPRVAQRMQHFFESPPPTTPFPGVTAREHEVLALLAKGRSNPDIAAALHISGKTVRNHVSNLFTKLQVLDRAEAIVRARSAGIGVERRDPSDRDRD